MKKLIFCLTVFISVTHVMAQSDSMNVTKSFLIIKSTKNYQNAFKTAKKASSTFNYELNLEGYYKDKDNGLTSIDTCDCGVRHGYIPRGRYNDGIYVSIEYTSYFEGFSKGYYIVVVGSGPKEPLKKILGEVRVKFSDAYIKEASVYMGCIH